MTAVTDNVLGLLGLARRSGNLAIGEEPVAELCRAGRAKAVFLARDAGASTARRAQRLAELEKVSLVNLPYTKQELGWSLGRESCALLAPVDLGLTAAVVRGLSGTDESLLDLARRLEEKAGRRGHGKRTVKSGRAAKKPADVEAES